MPAAERKVQRIVSISTAEYPTAARRPANSVLSSARLEREWGVALPAWEVAFDWAFPAD
jgi:dTDP-4-dehydrorhamnose reductase